MVNYTSEYQLEIEEFNSLYQLDLNPENRWIQLGAHLPWDLLVKIYSKRINLEKGAKTINPRVVIGAFIVKHKLNLTDQETLQTISENPYIQFFLGQRMFCTKFLFSPTLFVEFRKRMGKDCFDDFSEELMKIAYPETIGKENQSEQNLPNKGSLKLDATVADQYISYPNDLGLINEARIKTENIIDLLFEQLREDILIKPKTYRKVAHARYMSEAKKRQKNKASLRKAIRYLLNCVERNIKTINNMLDMLEGRDYQLPLKSLRQLWIINTLYEQQRKMYQEKSNQCNDRIVSISQPHVRPIVRGKQGKRVEFGSKLGLSLMDGFVKADTLSWNAYNEAHDLKIQAQAYKSLYGYYPEIIQVDKIYGTNQNRAWCKERSIRLTVTPKGRQPKKTPYQKRKERKEYGERNQVEGKFGQAKQGYGLNQIKAKLKETSETWIGAILFLINCIKFAEISGFTF